MTDPTPAPPLNEDNLRRLIRNEILSMRCREAALKDSDNADLGQFGLWFIGSSMGSRKLDNEQANEITLTLRYKVNATNGQAADLDMEAATGILRTVILQESFATANFLSQRVLGHGPTLKEMRDTMFMQDSSKD